MLAAADGTGPTNCTKAGCYFGPPVPVPNFGVSTCLFNVITSDMGGTLNVLDGSGSLTLTLDSTAYLTGETYDDPTTPIIEACPICDTGTGPPGTGTPGDGTCKGGVSHGLLCSTSTDLLTSVDCRPPQFMDVGTVPVDLSPLMTGSQLKEAAVPPLDGIFCPEAGQGASQRGALSGGSSVTKISVDGLAAGDLRAGEALPITLASIFCVPATVSPLVNFSANLPGPGTISLAGTGQLADTLPPLPTCGNDVREEGEQCDGSDLGNCLIACDSDCKCGLGAAVHVLLGANDDSRGFETWLEIDEADGTAVEIGLMSGCCEEVKGLAFDPIGEIMYGIDGDAGLGSRLLLIDAVTGLGTAIGPTGLENPRSLAFNVEDGSLYTVDVAGDNLYRIDPSTGAATLIGPTGFGNISGLAFAPHPVSREYTLYASDVASDRFLWLDTASGAGTRVHPTNKLGFDRVHDIAFDIAAGTMYAVEIRNDRLLTVNLGTGQAALAHPTNVLGFGKVRQMEFGMR